MSGVNKEFKTIDERIALLKSRNLKFKNEDKAVKILQTYSYFDIINSNEKLFQNNSNNHKYYIYDIYFEDLFYIYCFNQRLSSLTMDNVLYIELSLKNSIAYRFSEQYCTTLQTAEEYTNKQNYVCPPINQRDLYNKFNNFHMFRNDFVSTLKSHYTYMATYDKLPLWVALKGLTLGNIAYMILFLNSNIKSNIKMDMQIDSISNDAFDYGIYLLKEIRNNCAHGEMVYRFSKKYNVRYLNVASAVNEFGLNRTDAKYIDVLRVLSKFISKKDLRKIKRCILMFYIHFLLIGRKKIATKILGKMGNSDIKVWMNL